jgi:uncharacterized membrane protein HdeD (DUF308 family)
MKHWLLILIAGIVAIIGGIVALLNPLAATILATTLAAWLFIIVGILTILAVFSDMSIGRRIWTAILGILSIFLGISILGNPLAGVLALTVVVAIVFLVEGLTKVILSFSTRGTSYFWILLLSGIISVVLAVMILSDFPQSATVILGLLLAIDLISTGASMVALGLHLKEERTA